MQKEEENSEPLRKSWLWYHVVAVPRTSLYAKTSLLMLKGGRAFLAPPSRWLCLHRKYSHPFKCKSAQLKGFFSARDHIVALKAERYIYEPWGYTEAKLLNVLIIVLKKDFSVTDQR